MKYRQRVYLLLLIVLGALIYAIFQYRGNDRCSRMNLQHFRVFEEKKKQEPTISESSRDYFNLKHGLAGLEDAVDEEGLDDSAEGPIYPRLKAKGNYTRNTIPSAKFNYSSDSAFGARATNSYHSKLMNKTPRSRSFDPILVVRDWRRYIDENHLSSPSIPSNSKTSKSGIPSVIWTYWPEGEGNMPPLLAGCLLSWRRYNPLHTVIVLSRNTIEKVLDFSLPSNFDLISPTHQKDWVKLAILMQEGGTWVEPAFLMTRSISFVEQKLKDSEIQSEGLMFFMDYYTFYPKYPFYEGYFISVVRGSKLITHWFLEWSFCIEEYRVSSRKYLAHLEHTFGEFASKDMIQGLPDESLPQYLSLVCLQKVIQADSIPPPVGISAFNYPFGPMYLQEQFDGFSWDLALSLIEYWDPNNSKLPAFVYLRPIDLVRLELQVLQGWKWLQRFGTWNMLSKLHHRVHRGSFYCIYIMGMDTGCGGKIM